MNYRKAPPRADAALPHSAHLQAAPQGRASRPIARTIKGGGVLVLMAVLFAVLFWQNLPSDPLNPPGAGLATAPGAPLAAYEVNTANQVDRTLRLLMIAISLSIFGTRWMLLRSLAKTVNRGLVAFLALALFSAAWSIDSSATLLRFTTLTTVVMVCLAVALSGWDRNRLKQVTIVPTMLILTASLVLGMMYPDRIVELGDDISLKNSWHGVTHSKNMFGMMAGLGATLCMHGLLAREKHAIWQLAGLAVSGACLVLSRSSTSLLAAMVGIGFMVSVMRVPLIRRRFSGHVVFGIAAMILLYELVIQNVVPGVNTLLAPITALTGKDTTFSSRTMIWDIIKQHIAAAPLLGSGFGAYWTGPTPSSPSYAFVWLMYFYPTESHNGYLEIVNDVGLVGLMTLLLFIWFFLRQNMKLMKLDRPQASLYLALFLQEMVINMSESDWFSRSSNFAVILLATFLTCRALHEYKVQSRAAMPRPASVARDYGST